MKHIILSLLVVILIGCNGRISLKKGKEVNQQTVSEKYDLNILPKEWVSLTKQGDSLVIYISCNEGNRLLTITNEENKFGIRMHGTQEIYEFEILDCYKVPNDTIIIKSKWKDSDELQDFKFVWVDKNKKLISLVNYWGPSTLFVANDSAGKYPVILQPCKECWGDECDEREKFPEMAIIAGGTFWMGCTSEQGEDCWDGEKPAHQVSVNSFRMSKTEITNLQYAVFLNDRKVGADGIYNGNILIDVLPDLMDNISYLQLEYIGGAWQAKVNYKNHPMINVTWYGAYEYCDWADGRLPSEEEWEYAARGGIQSKGYKYAGSNNIEEVAWFSRNRGNHTTHKVATKQPNELGLYDMSGNVWEWCSESPLSAGLPHGYCIYRGGSWYDSERDCRSSNRFSNTKDIDGTLIGFRLVRP